MNVTPPSDDFVFRCEGLLYDASTLTRVETRDDQAPVIYLTKDMNKAFLLSREALGNFRITLLPPHEVRRLLSRVGQAPAAGEHVGIPSGL